MSRTGSRPVWLLLLALLGMTALMLVEPRSGTVLAQESHEIDAPLPASQRTPIPWIDVPPWALPAQAIPEEADESLIVPAVTLRSPEPITPPPFSELRIVLDWYLSPQHAPLLLARELGYFDRQGLKVNIMVPADPSVPTKLLAASRVDLALGRQTQLHKQVDEGLPLIRVATLIGTPMTALTVREDSNIETLAQLSDKTIGYAVSDSEPELAGMLSQYGLTPDDMTLHNANFTLSQALLQQRVDAVIAALRHTFPLQMEEEGVLTRSFLAEEHGYPTHDGLIIMANRDHLATKRAEIKRLLVALEEATQWMLNHPDEAWQRVISAESSLDTPLNRRAWRDTLMRLAQRPSALDARRYAMLDSYLHEHGHIRQRYPVERLAIDLHAP